MYKVIKHFRDLQDKNYSYEVGDIFPREGLKVTEERLEELAGSNNKQGRPLIELVEVHDDEPTAESKEVAPAQQETAPKKGAKKAAGK